MPNILSDQIVAGSNHEMPTAQVPKAVQYGRHAHRDRGLAGAGTPGKAHVQGGPFGCQAKRLAQTRHKEQRRKLPEVGLDRSKTHQPPIEFVKHLFEVGIPMSCSYINERFLAQRRGCFIVIAIGFESLHGASH